MDSTQFEARTWNLIHVEWLIKYMESSKASLERFDSFGKEVVDLIDNYITELESLRSDAEIAE